LLQSLLEHCDLLNTDISQGSVATYLRCAGIFKDEFVANLPLSLSCQRKNFENRLTFGEVMGKSLVSHCVARTLQRTYASLLQSKNAKCQKEHQSTK